MQELLSCFLIFGFDFGKTNGIELSGKGAGSSVAIALFPCARLLTSSDAQVGLNDSFLHQTPGLCGRQICEESPFGLSVNKMRGRVLFFERVGRLCKMEGDAALKSGARGLGRPGTARALRAAGKTP